MNCNVETNNHETLRPTLIHCLTNVNYLNKQINSFYFIVKYGMTLH
jgi:hypothetical protein